uniref:AGC-kinase C-terminal domain-containing protein n=1 Tax=Podarcis muralis TaxID=64176 RepID=A0A670I0B8_PODMU
MDLKKSKEDVSNFDPEFLKEEPILTPIEEGILSMINQDEFKNFSYTDPELESSPHLRAPTALSP